MSIYKTLTKIGEKYLGLPTLFRYGFNLSPMYRRSTAKVNSVSNDLLNIVVKLPISYKNRNYMNTIFGGSMFSATDPIYMIQLIYILGDDYVVWDKSAEIFFKRPAREDLYADFVFTSTEIEEIKQLISQENEITITKTTCLMNQTRDKIYCEIKKTIYIADAKFYKEKKKSKNYTR